MDYRALLLVPLAAVVLSVSAAAPRMPDDWDLVAIAHSRESNGANYQAGIDPASEAAGVPVLSLRSTGELLPAPPTSVGAVSEQASGYGGQRVRFSAEVRKDGASPWAGLFITPTPAAQVPRTASGEPGVEHQLPLGVPVSPGADWQHIAVVIDVPAGAPLLSVGLALVGEGQVWARKFSFEVVGPEVPVTTTPIGIDWAASRDHLKQGKRIMAGVPPRPLANAQLD
jgi:hypothetical protein